MPYIVNFTDRENKTPITVFDNTSNEDTSLSFPGRNVTGYGKIIAENFLALLENFAGSDAPDNPIEGQLWYDSFSGILQVWDNTQWKAASNIQRSNVEPSVEQSKVGELWVDTTNQQLYVFSGENWILVGPNFSTGLRSGPVVESIIDSDNITRVVLTFFVEDKPVVIISKDTFTPKNSITGFSIIQTGINITTENISNGDTLPKFYGTSLSAESLKVGEVNVESSKFLRTDTINTTEQGFNVRSNSGITIGVDGTFSVTASSGSARIYNASPGSSIDLQTNRNGIPETVLRVVGNTVGINQAAPEEALDVVGNVKLSGSLILTNVEESTNLNNGALRTAGGISVGKNVLIGSTLEVFGTSITSSIEPRETDRHDIGSLNRRWNTVRAKTIIADTIVGPLQGNIIGNSTTATNLRFPTTFRMIGDVTAPSLIFDGQVGGTDKVFTTTLTAGLISSKAEPSPNRSDKDDFILTFRSGVGLQKQRRDIFISDLGVPIGAIMPFAGVNIPFGYLLCDGGEVEIAKYRDLYNVIGELYGTASLGAPGLTFVLPDLRGRFPLGKDNMDNGNLVPIIGGFVDGGGGDINRVGGGAADNLGGSGGASSNLLTRSNLPQHEHTMKGTLPGSEAQYYAIGPRTTSPTEGGGSFLGRGGTTPGQFQYLPTSGNIKDGSEPNQPFSVMNPYLTINYIIRSGPASF
jgi:microcystin-dependent protein